MTTSVQQSRIPMIVSPDDHIIEPPHLWTSRLPAKYRDSAPQTRRLRGKAGIAEGWISFDLDDDGKECDVWFVEGKMVNPTLNFTISAGLSKDEINSDPMTFDEMRPSILDPAARIRSMDEAGIWASLCYPNMFVRFAGQRLSDIDDKELALLSVQAYNDFVVEEWCAGSSGRLLPMCIVPLWDVKLAAAEIERCAALGFKAVAFSEGPHLLGLPSIHSGYWDPFFVACERTGLVIGMHFGTGGPHLMIAKEAIGAVQMVTPALNQAHGLIDMIFSGVLWKFPNLKVMFAESQMGWIPYILHRADTVWEETDQFVGIDKTLMPEPPSFYFDRNIWVTFFKDQVGIDLLDRVGSHKVLYETDFPHQDSSFPSCHETAARLTASLTEADAMKLVAGNACALFGIDPAPYLPGRESAGASSATDLATVS